MPFVITGPRSEVIITDADEKLFHELPRSLQLATPQCDRLWEAFYADPKLTSPEQVRQFRDEIAKVLAAYESSRRESLIREKRIHAKNRAWALQALMPLLESDSLIRKGKELLVLCGDAIEAGHGLTCTSD